MIRYNTPVEDYIDQYGLLVKREDLSCPPPGPPFSKTRGVYAHVKARPEKVIGVLDTYHSQAGHAVALACRLLGKRCVNFYPVRKAERYGAPIKPQQKAAIDLGAIIRDLPAGRSAILFHQAKKILSANYPDSYIMPNALKLPEMVTETAAEVRRTLASTDIPPDMPVLIAASSGTIAAGVIKGFHETGRRNRFIIHQGYSRSLVAIHKYVVQMSGVPLGEDYVFIDEGYSYGDVAKPGETPPWQCNTYYDLKAFRWWLRTGRQFHRRALLWNIG